MPATEPSGQQGIFSVTKLYLILYFKRRRKKCVFYTQGKNKGEWTNLLHKMGQDFLDIWQYLSFYIGFR